MSNKLQNIKAIKQMLDGTHKSQTKSSFSFVEVDKVTEQNKQREVGETWTDANGVEWEQRKGFRIQKSKYDAIRDMLVANRMPANCPECKQPMTKRLDKKFWALEKRCFDCQVAFEHDLRIEGKFEEYERNKILQNAESWLKDAEQEANEIIEAFKNELSFANSDGTVEKWSGGLTGDEIAERIKQEFELFKQNFINKIKNDKT